MFSVTRAGLWQVGQSSGPVLLVRQQEQHTLPLPPVAAVAAAAGTAAMTAAGGCQPCTSHATQDSPKAPDRAGGASNQLQLAAALAAARSLSTTTPPERTKAGGGMVRWGD